MVALCLDVKPELAPRFSEKRSRRSSKLASFVYCRTRANICELRESAAAGKTG